MTGRTYRRSHYFVKPDLQTKYAFMFVLSIGTGLNLGVILSLVAPILQKSAPTLSIISMLLIGIALIAFVAGISIVFTHKIAGPIFKIERSFRQIIDEKDLSVRIALRTDDELQELAEEVNRLLDHFHSALLLERQKQEALLASLDLLLNPANSAEAPTPELSQQLVLLREKIAHTGLKYKLN
jgi:methyl-accepting chemotaxis protein